jgi:prepilin-type N-terminal cleavage/methylation domain-containing protein
MKLTEKQKRFFLIAALIAVVIGIFMLIKWLRKNGPRIFGGQKGLTLIEALVSVAILAAIGVVYMRAMATGYKNVGIIDEQLQAEALIRSELEIIKNMTYADNKSYPVSVSVPANYSMNITVTAPMHIGTTDNNTPLETLMGGTINTIQEINVTVYHGTKQVLSVGEYKIK